MGQLINFENRHIGLSESDKQAMLDQIGIESSEKLIRKIIPQDIQLEDFDFDLKALTEFEYLGLIREKADQNKVFRSLIGQGYYGTHTPSVIRRNIFENPGWYTQYTPYQAEISQGRLEALFNFQTVISDLTGLPIANASLLDEGTAAAEAVTMITESVNKKNRKNPRTKCYVHQQIFEQTKDVIQSRTEPLELETVYFDTLDEIDKTTAACIVIQYPDATGNLHAVKENYREFSDEGIGLIAICDILALTLIKSPGELGFDVAVGSTQRLGVPMGYGGPHAGYFACLDKYKRILPGRIIGLSKDIHGHEAYRMALQTREQHIKREKATSNICTAQALLAIMAGMYAVFHGPKNLKRIAFKIHLLASGLNDALKNEGYKVKNTTFFDTISIELDGAKLKSIRERARNKGFNFYYDETQIRISLDELSTEKEIHQILEIFNVTTDNKLEYSGHLENGFLREDDYLSHPIFHSHRSETQMMRYIKSLENKDMSLVHTMIPLGSCTMKLNAASELIPVAWSEFADIHPFTPPDQVIGYSSIINELADYLCQITGFEKCSFQPNSGAQGEYAGLLVIRAYHKDHGNTDRNLMLIPASAHGTNPASAVMAGYKVVIVDSDSNGNINLNHLNTILEEKGNQVAGFMVTYPSTHGVFESTIKEACEQVHKNGGLVYMDGANMNAQIGYTSPGKIGADVCHLNLHKTFAIPHGGGGPGMGPICVNEKLVEYLPGHHYLNNENKKSIPSVASAPFGSASILLISYAYIRMLGARGLKNVTRYAILNANYIKSVLAKYYDIVYTGEGGFVAHELILDLRSFKELGISAEDIAKRLIDYGFHAPTLSFPVAGTLMIEPTESEDKEELDRFCNAMIQIREEIDEIARGEFPQDNNVLINAPHPLYIATADEWGYPYSREKALYPVESLKNGNKFFINVARVDNAFGDRNLICTCPPIEAYMEE